MLQRQITLASAKIWKRFGFGTKDRAQQKYKQGQFG